MAVGVRGPLRAGIGDWPPGRGQVAGGEGGIWKVFPHGMPGIELVHQVDLYYNSPAKLDLAQHLGLNVREPDYLYERPRG